VVHDAVLGAVGFGVWVILLALAVVTTRGALMLFEKKKITEFPGGVEHGGEGYRRLVRAHANAAENVGVAAAILLAVAVVNLDTWAAHTLPWVILGARVAQSIIHISSGAAVAIWLRVTAFSVQLMGLAYLALEIVQR